MKEAEDLQLYIFVLKTKGEPDGNNKLGYFVYFNFKQKKHVLNVIVHK